MASRCLMQMKREYLERHYVPYAVALVNINMISTQELTIKEKALLAHIEKKKEDEVKHSYEIEYEDRIDAGYSWLAARKKATPFNVYLHWSFEFDPADAHDNAFKVRSIAHHILAFLHRNGKVPSNVIWTRQVAVGSHFEENQLICHIPDSLYQDFRKYACKWEGLSIEVSRCGYEKEFIGFDGRSVTVFDLMFAATSSKTRSRMPGVYSIDSDICYRPRVFTSHKLSRKQIESDLRILTAEKQIEALQARLDQQKGIA